MAQSSHFHKEDNRTWPRTANSLTVSKTKFVSSLGKRPNKFQPVRIIPARISDTIEDDDSEKIESEPRISTGILENKAKEDSFNANKENINIFSLKPYSASVINNYMPMKQSHSVKLSECKGCRRTDFNVKETLHPTHSLQFGYKNKRYLVNNSTETFVETSEKGIQASTVKIVKDAETNTEKCVSSVKANSHLVDIKTLFVNGNSYTILNKLGSGGSSVVYRVYDQRNKALRAVKYVKLPEHDMSVTLSYLNEVKLLERLQKYDCVIKLYDYEYLRKEGILYMVLEVGDTDFSKLIRGIFQSKKSLHVSVILYYWNEMLKAVKCIHDNGVIHSDLKPSNFLLVSGRLKLIDFGIASSVQSDVTSVFKESAVGTINYMSPESIRDTCRSGQGNNPLFKIRYRSDVWSLGCILYLLVYGKTPFQHITNPFLKVAAIQDPNTKINFPPLKCFSNALRLTMMKCLTFDPTKRPTVSELLEMKYI